MNLFSTLITALCSTFSYALISRVSMGFTNNSIQEGVITLAVRLLACLPPKSCPRPERAGTRVHAAQSSPCAKNHSHRMLRPVVPYRIKSQAIGGLGDSGFGNNRTVGKAGVGSLSYNMHVDMAAKYSGRYWALPLFVMH